MKKYINTKKIFVVAVILSTALIILPVSSFAKGGKGGGRDSLVCGFKGDIEGLIFDFGDGFTLDFEIGGFEVEATITSVKVISEGQEVTVVIPPKQFIYSASLSDDSDSEDGTVLADATLDYGGGIIEEDVTLVFVFEFATIFEQFNIKKKDKTDTCEDLENITVPKKVDLFFEITETRLVLGTDDTGEYLFSDPFNLVLVIDKGKPVLVDTFEFDEK